MDSFLERVNSISWFSNCGNKFYIDNFPIKLSFVGSIDEMMKNISSHEWENFTLEARNRLTAFLHKNNCEDYARKWNRIVDTQKNNLVTIENTAKKFANEKKLEKVFVSDVNWNVLGAAMESYYIKINENIPVFFKYLLEVYERGNIPCGWAGKEPENYGCMPIDISDGLLLVY